MATEATSTLAQVLHGDFGGFNLSEAAVQHLKTLGWGVCTRSCEKGYCYCDSVRDIDRSHTLLLQTVAALGIAACGENLYLAHLQYPSELPEEAIRAACGIHEYDGNESLQFNAGLVLEWMLDHELIHSVAHAKQVLTWARQCAVTR